MQKLYGSHASPLTRIVQGLPTSWDPSIATKKTPSDIQTVVWSPCSRLIAIVYNSYPTIVEVLDAITFKQHVGFKSSGWLRYLIFSPDTCLLSCVRINKRELISWDLQTGVSVSTISLELEKNTIGSLTYSPCGTMVGVVSVSAETTMICTYNILSGINVCSHSVQGLVLNKIWTDGENLQFAMFESGTITIWEVGFISEHSAVRVKSLPIPDDFDSSMDCIFFPTLSWLAYSFEDVVSVWDAQHSKLLLGFDFEVIWTMTASSNGHFFAYGTDDREISVWKKSPTGYDCYQGIISGSAMTFSSLHPHLSPDGGSIIVSQGSTLQLFHMTDFFIDIFQSANPFIVEFSPDRSLVVITRQEDGKVVVLDLKSGVPQLTVDTGMEVYCLKIVESSINVIGRDRIVTWSLPERNHTPSARVDINDSVQTTTFDSSLLLGSLFTPSPSISPDLSYIASVDLVKWLLKVHEISTGKCLGSVESVTGDGLWFTPDGQEVWYNTNNGVKGWMIVKSDLGQVELQPTQHQPEGCPWKSSYGYKVTHDGWVLSPSGRQLLWLPPHWQSKEVYRQWNGQFLALLHPDLPKIVILEFPGE